MQTEAPYGLGVPLSTFWASLFIVTEQFPYWESLVPNKVLQEANGPVVNSLQQHVYMCYKGESSSQVQ